MNIQQAKQIQLVDLLEYLGYTPTHIGKAGDDVWYFSPLRDEDTPSFHISLKYNCWFDFGESNRGDNNSIIDFVMKYKRTDVKGALSYLSSLKLPTARVLLQSKSESTLSDLKIEIGASKVEIVKVTALFSYPLKNYLKDERRISLELGYKYLKEVRYKVLEGENRGKEFYSLGFRNRAGGWVLRNKFFKTATTPNDISLLEIGSDKVAVYEGFMDFLSHLVIKQKLSPVTDVVVLNSNSFRELGIDFIKQRGYKDVYCFLDNDASGKKTLDYFKHQLPKLVVDCSDQYRSFNDLNEFLVGRG